MSDTTQKARTLGEGAGFMQYRDIQYDMQVTVGRSQWIWIIHTTSKSIQGSVQGARRVAILAAEKTIEDGGRGACASCVSRSARHNATNCLFRVPAINE